MNHIARNTRLTAVALLLVWIGPVVQTDVWRVLGFVGAPQPARAGCEVLPGGRVVPYSALYAPRLAAEARTSSYATFLRGATLRVSLRERGGLLGRCASQTTQLIHLPKPKEQAV